MKTVSIASRAGVTLGLAVLVTFVGLAERRTASQLPAPAAPSRFVETDLVIVDVMVTESSGQQAQGLQAADFTLLEDGVPKPIENFAEVPATGPAGPMSYYLLGYKGAKARPGEGFRSLRVRVSRTGTNVRFRSGYYAQQDEFTRGAYPEDTPDLVAPVVKERTEAKYTVNAMRAKIQGNVVVDVVVGADGKVLRTRVGTSLDNTYGLDEEALTAVQKWTFTAGELNGDKVPVLMKVVVGFRLH